MSDDATLLRSVLPAAAPSPSPVRRRWGTLLVGAVVVASLLGAACGDDSDDGGGTDRTTTEATEPDGTADAPDEPGGTGSTSTPVDTTQTSVDNSQGRPLNETDELVAALVEPGVVAERLEVAPQSVGNGAFEPKLCLDREVEVTWEDQASQGLLRSGEGGTLIVRQSVLAFADAEAADAFIDDVVAVVESCNPIIVVEPLDGIGERAVRFGAPEDGPPTGAGALVRVGSHVTYLDATGDPDEGVNAVVSDELLASLAEGLPR